MQLIAVKETILKPRIHTSLTHNVIVIIIEFNTNYGLRK